ncbi:MAG: DNA polymerase III subunit epsilon [Gammaproteobacteria bacterium]|nr:DNA polymerase III subunit epsilon [Gammaproteobacteria bacterium]
MRQVVLDTETTGLSTAQGHRIIEIGCLEMINRKVTGRHYHQYINPQREIDAGAIAVHGITNESLANKPFFADICDKFMRFVDGAELIIHNAPFDIGFLNYELSLLNKSWKSMTDYCQVIDSLVLARKMYVGQRNSLDALCKRLFVDNSKREFHGALLDADLLARVYLAMTGGQATLLFSHEQDSTEVTNQADASTAIQKDISRIFKVIKANEEELTENKKILETMAAKGKCLWL